MVRSGSTRAKIVSCIAVGSVLFTIIDKGKPDINLIFRDMRVTIESMYSNKTVF